MKIPAPNHIIRFPVQDAPESPILRSEISNTEALVFPSFSLERLSTKWYELNYKVLIGLGIAGLAYIAYENIDLIKSFFGMNDKPHGQLALRATSTQSTPINFSNTPVEIKSLILSFLKDEADFENFKILSKNFNMAFKKTLNGYKNASFFDLYVLGPRLEKNIKQVKWNLKVNKALFTIIVPPATMAFFYGLGGSLIMLDLLASKMLKISIKPGDLLPFAHACGIFGFILGLAHIPDDLPRFTSDERMRLAMSYNNNISTLFTIREKLPGNSSPLLGNTSRLCRNFESLLPPDHVSHINEDGLPRARL